MLEKLEWQSRMYNPESLATLGIQDTGKRVFFRFMVFNATFNNISVIS